jgi:hypothetical protein
MKIKYIILTTVLLIVSQNKVSAQSNALSSSPYSLYGLGTANDISTGKTNGMGRFGFAIPSNSFINNSNPASFGGIPKHSFFYDFGFKTESNNAIEGGNSSSNSTANFSNIGIAFPITEKSGVGVTLIPFTSVGYTISGIETYIEGSTDIFSTTIYGDGGINNLKLNYGYALTNKFRLGLTFSALFGKISETETNYILTSTLNSIIIEDENYYKGVRFGTGFQYDVDAKTSIGGILNFPTVLGGDSEGTTTISTNAVYELIETDSDLDDFKLPLEVGFGLKTILKDEFTVSLDYKRSFWDATNQMDQTGTFVDQNFFGAGVQFKSAKNQLKFLNRLEYRAGFNYDSGNIEIENTSISNSALNLGIGVPLKRDSNSMINISYSYGSKGTINDGLIKENYHLLSVNLSLEGIWFQKRKIF